MPIVAISGQRVVHNLRSIRATSFGTQDLSQVIDQQIRGFASTSLGLPREADNHTLPVIIEEEEEDTHMKGIEMVDMSGHDASSFDVEVDNGLPGESSLCLSEDWWALCIDKAIALDNSSANAANMGHALMVPLYDQELSLKPADPPKEPSNFRPFSQNEHDGFNRFATVSLVHPCAKLLRKLPSSHGRISHCSLD